MSETIPSWKNRDRRFKQIVSLFIFASMILVLGILWLGHTTSHPFDSKYDLYMELTHAEGIKKDTPVTLAGIPVGKVAEMQFTAHNRIRVTLRLLKQYMEQIRRDSVVTLSKPLVGNVSLDIHLGSPDTPALQNAQQIALGRGSDITDLLSQVPATLAHVDEILANLKTLTKQLVEPDQPFQQSLLHTSTALADLSRLTQQLNQKDQGLQRTMENLDRLSTEAADMMHALHQSTPKMVAELNHSTTQTMQQVKQTVQEMQTIIQSVRPLLGQVQQMLENTNKIAGDVSKVTEQLGKASPEIPVFINQGQDFMRETETLLHRVNNSILFGSSGNKDAAGDRLTVTPREMPMLQPATAP
ncbi:MAG: MlaD family protein [Magnetococcus sp. XQGC-1]